MVSFVEPTTLWGANSITNPTLMIVIPVKACPQLVWGRESSFSGLNRRVDDWSEFLSQGVDYIVGEKLQRHERTGRPLGSERFVMRLEGILDRILRSKKPGRPKKENTRKKQKNI